MTRTVRQLRKAARIILIGAPGVGKGTQTERLLTRFPDLASISSGDLLRENVRRKTPLGLKAEAAMQSGNLVPDSMILELISSELKSKGWLQPSTAATTRTTTTRNPSLSVSSNASFILDGFPRTAKQASSLDDLVPVNFVVHLVTPPSVILSRIASRWVHEPSGRVYNTDFNAPKVSGKDDITGEPLTQRQDDSLDTWTQRLHKFEETSKALLDHYQRKGCLWRVEGDSSDEISPKLFAEIERHFC
ncbi:adenylate kinase ADK2 [Aspergillus saccharolyticus JOP 1030-1]|uniref:GTP:AMP phosphotransferase, mitochondrial n=1 Tax=Aspergillus saccharolyticus JOP 1030-1 TaxID=1450539 RepID=A0A318ZTR2_9EURO|nr:adenylate kinase [Aspergillus saccharolyticus JOP 1030-1]PYH50035.1 adenylate kinase [Aspergillus saccharolyticus JOP 1030-1]